MTGSSPLSISARRAGASSSGHVGRTLLQLEEVHRFPNEPVELPGGPPLGRLGCFQEILDGLARRGAAAERRASIGVDTWGVDGGCWMPTGQLVGAPVHYRDARHEPRRRGGPCPDRRRGPVLRGTASSSCRSTPCISSPPLVAPWFAAREDDPADARPVRLLAHRAGMAERTNASTTGLVDPTTREWARGPHRRPGSRASVPAASRARATSVRSGRRSPPRPASGRRRRSPRRLARHRVCRRRGAGVGDAVAYISSGTWSLVGLELDEPSSSDASRAANFTNEGGVDGRIRFLRNVMGLWLLQESLRTWGARGRSSTAARCGGRAASRRPDHRPR